MNRRRAGSGFFTQAMLRHVHHRSIPVPQPCPSWCEIDHGADADEDGVRTHAGKSLARVSLWATEDLTTGEWSQSIVVSRADVSGEQARALALEILDAVDALVDGAR